MGHALRVRKDLSRGHALRVRKDLSRAHALRVRKDLSRAHALRVRRGWEGDAATAAGEEPQHQETYNNLKRQISRSHVLRAI